MMPRMCQLCNDTQPHCVLGTNHDKSYFRLCAACMRYKCIIFQSPKLALHWHRAADKLPILRRLNFYAWRLEAGVCGIVQLNEFMRQSDDCWYLWCMFILMEPVVNCAMECNINLMNSVSLLLHQLCYIYIDAVI